MAVGFSDGIGGIGLHRVWIAQAGPQAQLPRAAVGYRSPGAPFEHLDNSFGCNFTPSGCGNNFVPPLPPPKPFPHPRIFLSFADLPLFPLLCFFFSLRLVTAVPNPPNTQLAELIASAEGRGSLQQFQMLLKVANDAMPSQSSSAQHFPDLAPPLRSASTAMEVDSAQTQTVGYPPPP